MAFVKTPYLFKMKWDDGDEGFCKPCDARVPLFLVNEKHSILACAEGHRQHALNVHIARSEGGEGEWDASTSGDS